MGKLFLCLSLVVTGLRGSDSIIYICKIKARSVWGGKVMRIIGFDGMTPDQLNSELQRGGNLCCFNIVSP